MPLYEYECKENGHRFEMIRKFSDPPLRKCIKCGSRVRRLLSAPAISFKGSGWYITDYARKGSGGNGTGSGAKGASGAGSSSGSGSSTSEKPGKSGAGKSD